MMSRDWIAPQVRQVPPSGIRKYFDLSGERADTIRLGVGEPDFTVPEPVREACVRALNEGRTGYTANSGMAELREALAGYLKESFGLGYEPESEIMITVGSSEAVDLALRLHGPRG